MKLVIDGNIKEFDNAQVEAAGEKCRALCEGCDIGLEECLLGTRDCPVDVYKRQVQEKRTENGAGFRE